MSGVFFNGSLEPADIRKSDRKKLSAESLLNVLATGFAFGQLFLTYIGRGALFSKYLVTLSAAILAFFVVPYLWRAIRSGVHLITNRMYVYRERTVLSDFRVRFMRFSVGGDNRSVVGITTGIGGNNRVSIERLVGSHYFDHWIEAFDLRQLINAKSIDEFFLDCREFTRIVDCFNQNYVFKLRESLLSAPPPAEHFIKDLEEFREEFNAYLRDLELWAQKLYLQARKRRTVLPAERLAPTTNFGRVATFRRSIAAP